jgi:replicative DNA helicase
VSDIDFERSVLGGILLDSRAYKEASGLRPDDFSLDSHRRICRRMIDLHETGCPIDILTLEEALSRHGELEAIGGIPYIASLTHGLPERPTIGHYVQKVREAAERRRAAELVEKAQRLANDPSVSGGDHCRLTDPESDEHGVAGRKSNE